MKIICIGRNYSEHAKELGNVTPSEPVVFLKPDTAINLKGHPLTGRRYQCGDQKPRRVHARYCSH